MIGLTGLMTTGSRKLASSGRLVIVASRASRQLGIIPQAQPELPVVKTETKTRSNVIASKSGWQTSVAQVASTHLAFGTRACA